MTIGPACESPNPVQRWLAHRIGVSIVFTHGLIGVPWVAASWIVYAVGGRPLAFPIVVTVAVVLIWVGASIYSIRRGPTAGLSPEDAARTPILYLPWFKSRK